MRRLLVFVGFWFLASTVVFSIYIGVKSIDDAVTTGSAYGFSIGQTKEQVYEQIHENLYPIARGNKLFIDVEVDGESAGVLGAPVGSSILVQSLFPPDGLSSFEANDIWKTHLDVTRLDSITFSFCGLELCRIYRRRQMFELP